MIAHEEQRGRFSNVRHTSQFSGPSVLDPVVTFDEQLAWLNGHDVVSTKNRDVARRDDPEQRTAGHQRYLQLLAHRRGELTCAVLHNFINKTIPYPRPTERRFWSVTAMPSTNGGAGLATLSVGNMEMPVLRAGRSGRPRRSLLRGLCQRGF